MYYSTQVGSAYARDLAAVGQAIAQATATVTGEAARRAGILPEQVEVVSAAPVVLPIPASLAYQVFVLVFCRDTGS